ncbi:MAG: flagellar basal body-associated FliL family protein [Planctomycetales bacterium]|nr:flagellar basal body-associated FliL family protein [Planctomycetales bacterium]
MADEEQEEGAAKKSKPLMGIIICAVIGFVSGGLGFAGMTFMMPSNSADPTEASDADKEKIFIPFGTISCNVNDGQLNRFLKLTITLQFKVSPEDVVDLEALIEKEKPILTSWLLSYLADMTMEDIRGAVGQNRLRREIQNHFSSVLFPDADGQIESLLFEEFIVQ